MDNVLSQTDGLDNVTTYAYNNLEQQTSSSQGQIVPIASGTASFANLPQTPGVGQSFEVYVYSTTSPTTSDYSGWSVADYGAGTATLARVGSSTTPLGSGWYDLGSVTLQAADQSSTLAVNYAYSGGTQICLVQQVSGTTYYPTGLVDTQQNADGGVTTYIYDADADQTSETGPEMQVGRPVTTDAYDALGRVTSETDPVGNITAYAYQFGTTSQPGQTVTTFQGQSQPVNPVNRLATFNNLPQAAGQQRTYTVYAECSAPPSDNSCTIDENGTAGPYSLSGYVTATTPLGSAASGWYELGTLTLQSGDASSTLTVTCSGSTSVSNVALLEANVG